MVQVSQIDEEPIDQHLHVELVRIGLLHLGAATEYEALIDSLHGHAQVQSLEQGDETLFGRR